MAGDGGAGHASVEARTRRFSAGATVRDLRWVSADGGAAAEGFDAEAVLKGAERLGSVAGAEVEEVGARRRCNLAVDV